MYAVRLNAMATRFAILIAVGVTAVHAHAVAQPMSGHVDWNGWGFDWAVESNAGVRIKNVYRDGTQYLHSAGMSAIRVQYVGNPCGPFLDRINWGNIIADNSGDKVRVTQEGEYLRVWVYAEIASYKLKQSWYFHESNGAILVTLESSGLQCWFDHAHHPYWRFDPDINGFSGDVISLHNNGIWSTKDVEFDETRQGELSHMLVEDYGTTKYGYLQPGPNDGVADAFSTIDYAGRLYHWPHEHEPWAPWENLYTDQGELVLNSNNGESINQVDIVFWYTGHLFHQAAEGPDQWHYAGPTFWCL